MGFLSDPDDIGTEKNYYNGFVAQHSIAVPGSWNEQLQEAGLMNYVGSTWLQKTIFIPMSFRQQSLVLRIGSAEFQSKVWVNGALVAENQDLFLPFEGNVSNNVDENGELTIVVWVCNKLLPDSVTQEVNWSHYDTENRPRDEVFPAVRFDFFPFGGIHRPVSLISQPFVHIEQIKVDTFVEPEQLGKVLVNVQTNADENYEVLCKINQTSGQQLKSSNKGYSQHEILINDCQYWDCEKPYLYQLVVMLFHKGQLIDEIHQHVGIREVVVSGAQLLLNGKPVFLRGFGKHEDSPIHGKGLNLPQMVKDFGLLNWINANSFRTSHYPYAEEILDYADKKGILIISEVPSVNLDFRLVNDKTLVNHKRAVTRQFARDHNHPSVIMWSIANEPGFLGEPEYKKHSPDYWKSLFSHARQQDNSRPMTIANVLSVGSDDPVFEFTDIICINRYYGWYQEPGQIDRALMSLKAELDYIGRKYGKPILVSEFGADTISGLHSTSDQMFTEEYQADLLAGCCKIIEDNDWTIGGHVWNFADFRASQHFRRIVFNLKGVFTRTREPKRAAFVLKDLWSVPYVKNSVRK